jgi:branched-subunit amino acid ABC-type transport system permease component
MEFDQIGSLLIGILFTISLLVVISIGLAVVFGMMGIINFAHGEFLMLGAFVTISVSKAGVPLALAMVAAALAVGALGLVVERVLIRRLYGRLEATMLATFGLSLILVQVAVIVWGTTTQGIATPLGNFRIGRYAISEYELVVVAAALGLLALVWWVFRRTRFGVMARAATQRPAMASAVGIDAATVNMGTFAFGAALAGAGGALLAPIVAVTPSMGAAYVARAFTTVVVGGPAAISGTAAASGLLGSVQRIVSDASTAVIGTVALLAVAIVLLRILPRGISGALGREL